MIKVTGFDGRTYNLKLNNNVSSNPSRLHLLARRLIHQIYPLSPVYEEISLPGTRTHLNGTLRCDFLLPRERIIVEPCGEQHYIHIRHFNKSKLSFVKLQSRDKRKKEWIALNGFELIQLSYLDNEEKWIQQLRRQI